MGLSLGFERKDVAEDVRKLKKEIDKGNPEEQYVKEIIDKIFGDLK